MQGRADHLDSLDGGVGYPGEHDAATVTLPAGAVRDPVGVVPVERHAADVDVGVFEGR